MFNTLSETSTRNSIRSSASHQERSKQDFKTHKLSGIYRRFDYVTGLLRQEGKFQYGQQVGLWRQIDQDGDEEHFQFIKQRVGARCRDGTRSYATGRGACSHHGGVADWIVQTKRHKVGGTGKYIPIEQRISKLKKQVKQYIPSNKTGQQWQEQILQITLHLLERNEELIEADIAKSQKLQQKQKDLQKANAQLEKMKIRIKKLQEETQNIECNKPSEKNVQKTTTSHLQFEKNIFKSYDIQETKKQIKPDIIQDNIVKKKSNESKKQSQKVEKELQKTEPKVRQEEQDDQEEWEDQEDKRSELSSDMEFEYEESENEVPRSRSKEDEDQISQLAQELMEKLKTS